MGVIDWFKGLFFGDAPDNPAGWLSQQPGPDAVRGPDNYVRFRLLAMRLEHGRRLATRHVPALQSVVAIPIGTKPVEVASTIGPSKFKAVGGSFQTSSHDGIFLTDWLPYNGGRIELVVGLISVPQDSALVNGIDALEGIAELVQVPAVSTVLGVAEKVASAAETLFRSNDKIPLLAANVELADDEVRSRYYVSVDADARALPLSAITYDPAERALLHEGRPIRDVDYFVLEMQVRATIGDEWDRLPELNDPFEEALEALDDPTKAERLLRQAWATAHSSDDLTRSDRARVGDAIKARWMQLRGGAPGPLDERAPDERRSEYIEFNT